MNVTSRSRRWTLAATLAVPLLLTLPATEARAGKGDKVTATVNGRRVKFRKKLVCGGYTSGAVAVVGGQMPHRLHQLARTIVVSCVLIDVTKSTFPVSPPSCQVGYNEIRFKPQLARQWVGASPDIQVTLEAFDGTRLQGSFGGTLGPFGGTTSAATVTNGTFSVLLVGGQACPNAPVR